MHKALEISLEIDLSPLSLYLRQQGIIHRIFESSGRQELWVARLEDVEPVRKAFHQFASGYLPLNAPARSPAGPSLTARLIWHWRRFPVTLVFVVLSVLCYPLTWGLDQGQVSPWLHLFTYTDFEVDGQRVLFAPFDHGMSAGQVWRLWTPMFIHFGLIHLTFNLLWVWEVGRRMELIQGSGRLFNLVMITSLVANGVQHLFTGPVLFGGMSGVVYGLLGYALVWSRLQPKHSFQLPPGIYIFMLAWLALGFSGIIDAFGFGSIANGAHLGGLLAGVMMAAGASVLKTENR